MDHYFFEGGGAEVTQVFWSRPAPHWTSHMIGHKNNRTKGTNNAPIPEHNEQYCFRMPLKLEVHKRYWTTRFLGFRLCKIFSWAMNLCKNFLSQTQELDSRKHLLHFFSMAPLTQLLFSFFFCSGILFWKLPNPLPPPPASHKKKR